MRLIISVRTIRESTLLQSLEKKCETVKPHYIYENITVYTSQNIRQWNGFKKRALEFQIFSCTLKDFCLQRK